MNRVQTAPAQLVLSHVWCKPTFLLSRMWCSFRVLSSDFYILDSQLLSWLRASVWLCSNAAGIIFLHCWSLFSVLSVLSQSKLQAERIGSLLVPTVHHSWLAHGQPIMLQSIPCFCSGWPSCTPTGIKFSVTSLFAATPSLTAHSFL